jgi:hypothetical protein
MILIVPVVLAALALGYAVGERAARKAYAPLIEEQNATIASATASLRSLASEREVS